MTHLDPWYIMEMEGVVSGPFPTRKEAEYHRNTDSPKRPTRFCAGFYEVEDEIVGRYSVLIANGYGCDFVKGRENEHLRGQDKCCERKWSDFDFE